MPSTAPSDDQMPTRNKPLDHVLNAALGHSCSVANILNGRITRSRVIGTICQSKHHEAVIWVKVRRENRPQKIKAHFALRLLKVMDGAASRVRAMAADTLV